MADLTPKQRGKRLRELRSAANLTRERLAPDADVSVSTIVRAEKGEAIGLHTAMKLAAALGVPVSELGYDGAREVATPAPAWAVKMQADITRILDILETHR